ncbi:MAG: ankyrin repeat domain-containing protein [Sedimentisphaerales bacterium]|nr:ankyrin repeat domain-containing protein [Sedimentisphaerales bacterium]
MPRAMNRDRWVWLLILVCSVCPPGARGNALHEAAKSGDVEGLKRLLAEGQDVDEKDLGNTALEYAAYFGHMTAAQVLLENGAERTTNSVLLAAQQGHKGVVELLIAQGIDVNVHGEDGSTPLFLASVYGHRDVVELLLGKGADIDRRTNRGITPLYAAVGRNDVEVTKFLIAKGANINTTNERGSTLLHLAAFNNDANMVEVLLAEGMPVNRQNNNGKTPLNLAVEYDHSALAQLLREHGGELTEVNKKQTRKSPFTVVSDLWEIEIVGLSVLDGKGFRYYSLLGMTGSMSQIAGTPDLSTGVIPNISLQKVGDQETIGWMMREFTVNEAYRLISLDVSIRNTSVDQMALPFADVKLANEDGFFIGQPRAFRIAGQPIYKAVDCPVQFPSHEAFPIEFVFIVPAKLCHVLVEFRRANPEVVDIGG